jgi:hypothetical protein
MSKLLLLIISGFVVTTCYSQNIQFGALLGPNLSGSTVKYPTYEVKSPMPGVGLDIGFFADVPLTKEVSFRPNLTYSLERASAVIEGDKA